MARLEVSARTIEKAAFEAAPVASPSGGSSMKRKALVLAVAGIVGAPMAAHAQSASVTIYGRLYPEIGYSKTSGATPVGTAVSTLVSAPTGENLASLYQENTSNSRFGLRGQEPLGGGLSAIFQLEQTINFDAGTGVLASRDSFVGLSSDKFGTVKLGNMDTVYKQLGDSLSFFGVSSGNIVSQSNILSKPGTGTSSSGSFHLRRANSVVYQSPTMHGFQLLGQYSPDEAKTPTRNAYLVSLGAKYENGPLYVALAYEDHRDLFGGSRNAKSSLSNFADQNARSDDTAVRATVKYEFGMHTVEADMASIQYKESNGAIGRFREYKHTTYLVGVDSTWSSAIRTAIAYARSQAGSCSLVGTAPCNTDGLEGSQVSLGGAYYFSRRTLVFALYTKLWNGKSARYSNLQIGDPAAGADIDQFMLGIAHNF